MFSNGFWFCDPSVTGMEARTQLGETLSSKELPHHHHQKQHISDPSDCACWHSLKGRAGFHYQIFHLRCYTLSPASLSRAPVCSQLHVVSWSRQVLDYRTYKVNWRGNATRAALEKLSSTTRGDFSVVWLLGLTHISVSNPPSAHVLWVNPIN